MAEPRSLPLNLEISLHVLERGHFLRHGGDLPSADLPGKVFQFLEMLEKDGLDWALVGAAALNLHHGRPRATVDLDIVVRPEDVPRMRKLLEEGCAHVDGDAERLQGTLSPAPMLLTIDVFQSGAHPLLEEALERQERIGVVRVPRLEVLLALKFLSSRAAWRARGNRCQDVADFMRAFKENARTVDRALLMDLASRAHENAREEFAVFLDAVENDKPITI